MKTSDRRRAEQDRAGATLATVDAALESGLVDGDDERERQLGRLALTLRAGVPEPSAAFEAKLEQELGASFASKRADGAASAARGGRARGARRRGAPIGGFDRRVVGALAVALLALAVGGGLLATVSGRIGGLSTGGGGGGAAPVMAPEEGGSSGRARRSAPPDTAVPSEGDLVAPHDGFSPGESERRIERTASLTLAVPEERIDTMADGVVAVADRHRGFVVTSFTSSGEDEEPGGSFDLRVPVEELRATLSDLAALGTVRAQSQTGDDVTESFATTEDRLVGARAERRSLLRRLERADTDREARALRAQLEPRVGRDPRPAARATGARGAHELRASVGLPDRRGRRRRGEQYRRGPGRCARHPARCLQSIRPRARRGDTSRAGGRCHVARLGHAETPPAGGCPRLRSIQAPHRTCAVGVAECARHGPTGRGVAWPIASTASQRSSG